MLINIFIKVLTKSEEVVAMKVDSVDFAIYLNKRAKENKKNYFINETKIQKWMYICYGLCLAKDKEKLLDEPPLAGEHGPVFKKVLRAYVGSEEFPNVVEPKIIDDVKKRIDSFIDPVLEHFGQWTPAELVAWTMKSGGAWEDAYARIGKDAVLPDSRVQDEFNMFVKNK